MRGVGGVHHLKLAHRVAQTGLFQLLFHVIGRPTTNALPKPER